MNQNIIINKNNINYIKEEDEKEINFYISNIKSWELNIVFFKKSNWEIETYYSYLSYNEDYSNLNNWKKYDDFQKKNFILAINLRSKIIERDYFQRNNLNNNSNNSNIELIKKLDSYINNFDSLSSNDKFELEELLIQNLTKTKNSSEENIHLLNENEISDLWTNIVKIENSKIILNSYVDIYFKWNIEPKRIYFQTNKDKNDFIFSLSWNSFFNYSWNKSENIINNLF